MKYCARRCVSVPDKLFGNPFRLASVNPECQPDPPTITQLNGERAKALANDLGAFDACQMRLDIISHSPLGALVNRGHRL